MLFAAALREMRDARRLSQSRLAEMAGFDHSYVSRLETGSRGPSRNAVVLLLRAMDVPPGDPQAAALMTAAGFIEPTLLAPGTGRRWRGLEALAAVINDERTPPNVREDLDSAAGYLAAGVSSTFYKEVG